MAENFNMAVLMTLVMAATMIHGSLGQTTHVVGDALGWLVPPGGEIAYSTWATTQTFTVGDALVFNFGSGFHDVAEVNKAAYDPCNGTSPISLSTNGPTTINLTSAGEHHFICTFSSHCELGQKLAINVSAASATPPPQSATPPPPATPETAPPPAEKATPPPAAPSPSRVGMTYIVGDSLGWLVLPGGPIAYETWARGKSFMVGDILVFNFINGAHDVAQLTKAAYDSCNSSSTTSIPITTSPARITLTTAGEHYYICTFTQHCDFGQKLAINVSASGATFTPPSSLTPAPSAAATPPSSSATPLPSPGGPTMQPITPSIPSTPSPDTAPPPLSNSAPSFAIAGLPLTFLAVALAFLYN